MTQIKLSVLVIAVVTAVLAAASPAAANPPTHEDIGTIPYEFTVDCSPFGLSFENQVQGVEELSVDTFYDSQGVVRKVVYHDTFLETDTNSVSGKIMRFTGNRVDTYDLVDGTRTVTGRSFLVTDPGRGVVIHDTGRVVFDAPFHVVFTAGPHDVLFGNVDQLACTALSE